MFKRSSFRVVALCATVALPCVASAQALPWRNDWTIAAQPSLQYSGSYDPTPQSPVAFSPDGEFLMRASSNFLDDQLVRFDSNGTVRWRAHLGDDGPIGDAAYGVMLPNADGSAFVAAQAGIALARIDADGSIAWSVPFSPLFLVNGTQGLIAQDCTSVAAFDATSGQSLWSAAAPKATYCAGTGVATDATGASYASFSSYAAPGYDSDVIALDANGTVLWDVHAHSDTRRRLVGVSGGLVYVGDTSSVIALNANDGSVRWTAAAIALGMGGSPAEVIANGNSGTQRLNATDGTPRWTQAQNISWAPGFHVLFCSAGDKAVYNTSRLDLNTGAIDFSVPLPLNDASGNELTYFTATCSSDGSSTFAATPRDTTINAAPFLQRVDNGGNLLAAVPIAAAPRGLASESIVVDAQTVASMAADTTVTGTSSAHVRGVDRTSGSTVWQTDLMPPSFFSTDGWTAGGLASGGGTIAATLAAGYAHDGGTNGGMWVYALDPPTGNVRWSKFLILTNHAGFNQLGTVSFEPLVDAQGNVIVSYGAEIYEYGSPMTPALHRQMSVVKLSAADGSIVWQHDEVFPSTAILTYQLYNAPEIFLLGTDVLVGGDFAAPNSDDTVRKLSGSDGTELWHSNVFSNGTQGGLFGDVEIADDGNPILFNGGSAKLDAGSGATLWSYGAVSPCVFLCGNGGGVVTLAGGDVLRGGQTNDKHATIVLFPGRAHAIGTSWTFDQQDTHLYQSWVATLNRDASGGLWARLQRNYRYYGQRIAWLVRFDPASGTLASQQAMYTNDNDPLLPFQSPFPLLAPDTNNRLLASTVSNNPPAPAASGVALIDTTIRANGDLSLTFNTDRGWATAGQPVAFHVTVNYSGDAPISGARVLVDFPWLGKATGVSCNTTSASNCVLDQRAATLLASFDMQPGGRIDLTGSIVALSGGSNVPLAALVVGPTALNELDPSNNSAWTTVEASIFRNGFE